MHKKTNPNNKSTRISKGNRPFEDLLTPLITTDIEKRINDLYSKVVRIIREENSEFKEHIEKQLAEAKNESVNQKISNIEEVLKQIEDESIINEFKEILDTHQKSIKTLKKQIFTLKKKCLPVLEVKMNNNPSVKVGFVHNQFEQLLKIIGTGLNVYLTGPAGSGKTTAAQHCAIALGVDFYFTGAIASEFKLTGFIDANGKIVTTEFRKAYEKGGLFLFDEIDGSFPQAVLAFNAALANDFMDFPDKRIKRHKNFYCIAAANTYGQGADRQYVGRNQLDAASLDRFIFIDWKYDEDLERKLSDNDEWVDYIQSVRSVIIAKEIRHVVSPRASMYGAKLLRNGISRKDAEESVLWKGLDTATIELIKENL